MLRFFRYLALVSFFALVFLISLHSLNSINQDIGRHLKLGEIIWQTKNVPQINLFSFTEPNRPFINHHWLSEVVFFLLFGIIGLKGLIVFKAVVITAAFGLIFLGIKKEAGIWPFLVSGFLGILVFSDRTDVRPEIFSYLFLAYFLFAIFRSKYLNQNRWLYALPAIQILWTNSHIYFVLGPGLLFFYLIERFFSKPGNIDKKRLFWIFIATTAAMLINPNFIRGALAPLNILKDYGYSIVENQSIFFLQNYGSGLHVQEIGIFIISIIFLAISFILAIKNSPPAGEAGRKNIIFEILTSIVFVVLGAKMIRNFGIYALIFTPIVAINLSSISRRLGSPSAKSKIIFYSAMMAISVLLIYGVVTNGFYEWIGDSRKFGLEIPAGAEGGVEFVKQNKLAGPMFNNFDIGSYLIWKLYPEQRVFVDGRPEAYGKEFFDKIYKPMQEDSKMWKYYSGKYNINYVFFVRTDITPWAQKFLSSLSKDKNWPVVYLDDNVVIFLKRAPENSTLIKKFEIK